ncbi:sodium:alanine symporter family protein [candidate division KSB1 bacterium]|nr:MAG: sodium:alanine symporter family protein [candidate division KSB1 bacterium]
MEEIIRIIKDISDIVWGWPLMILLVGTGMFLTLRLRGLQFSKLWHSLYLALIKRKEDEPSEGDITHFQALMTALAATVGTGNIAGVATAIVAGGPGGLFWMWITGLFGMATKYSEAVLAVKYRITDKFGTMSGGPMYYISKGLGWKWLGVVFAIFAAVASFGIGNMVQSNSVADAVNASFGVPFWVTGLILGVATALVIIGGIKSIGRVTGLLVPVMIVFYVLGALVILIINIKSIPSSLGLVFKGAFTPTAATGGFLGAGVKQAMRFGIARGVFSNESGLGSAPIAAAAAKTKKPVTQALVSMTQTFIDTICVCTMTGLVIISTGAWTSGLDGAELTTNAFNLGLPGDSGGIIVAIGLILFAYSTILGWSYYGEKSIEYLLGEKAVLPYRTVFCIFVVLGSVFQLQLVWSISDVMNGLMALPNLIGLLLLSGVIVRETKNYFM